MLKVNKKKKTRERFIGTTPEDEQATSLFLINYLSELDIVTETNNEWTL